MFKSRVSPPLQLALIFLLCGTIWILLTDVLTVNVSKNNIDFLSKVQTYKGVLFMLLGSMFIFLVSRRIIRKQYQLQDQLNKERIRYKNEMALEVFNAQEHERKKIGEDLHDNINQMLGVVKLYIEHAHMNPPSREEMLAKSSAYLRQVINEIRTISKALVSPTLADIGLVESIRELADTLLQIKEIDISVNADDFKEDMLNTTQKVMLYRIIQEQLNNIIKHSRAEHVDIELRQRNGMVSLTIQDDGIGFDTTKSTPGLGLKNMRHRLELFNGNMHIDSAPQEGCRLRASFSVA
jgi:signal transduction histidine kinase